MKSQKSKVPPKFLRKFYKVNKSQKYKLKVKNREDKGKIIEFINENESSKVYNLENEKNKIFLS